MSRFFQQNSTSESESESDNEAPPIQSRLTTARIPNYAASDDEEDVKARVVQPEREKRADELNGIIKQLKNAKKIRDVVKTHEMFEEMTKSYIKCKKIVEKDGHFKQYIRALGELETFIDEIWADTEWRASANGKNLANKLKILRQQFNKYKKDYKEQMDDFKENPNNYPETDKVVESGSGASGGEDSSSGDDSSSDSSSDEEEKKTAKAPKAKKPKKVRIAGDDDDDDDDWEGSESDDSTSDDEVDYDQKDIWKQFLKKDGETMTDKDKEKKEKDRKEKLRDERRQRETERNTRVDSDDDKDQVRAERPKLFTKDEKVTHVTVVGKLNEICSGRGRKGTDRKEQSELLNELREIAKKNDLGPAVDVKILFNLIAINFDYNPRVNKCMKDDNWVETLRSMEELLSILKQNENIEIGEYVLDDDENVADKTILFKIKGCVLTMTDRMVEEFVRILQQCDAHGTEYVERLKDEPKICGLIDTLQEYLEKKNNKQELCRIYLKKVENLYFKFDKNNKDKSSSLIDILCKFIYTNDDTDRLRTKAMLCHIYHNALHDRWFEARDLMLMSHLQESIDHSDIPLQILYNRTMVQVGLCAFRVGNIKESHAALLDIQSGNRAKELLAQGMMIQRNVEKTKEQEMKERQRLIPFHMHINLELLECVYLVSAMLIEVPYMCSRDFETKKRMISKQFHYQLKISERQPVVGPPENMREHVVAASRSMRNGDWRSCVNYLVNEKMNAKVWDLMPQSTNVKAMLTEKVKEESLRSYLFRYSSVYESISIENLAEIFELPRNQVYSIISKMIINEELMASLDEPTQTVVMHRTEPTKLQTLALQLSEKISTLMDNTERMTQLKGGEMGGFLARNQQGGQQGGQHNQQTNNQRGEHREHRGDRGDHRDNRNQSNWKQNNNRGNQNQRNNNNQNNQNNNQQQNSYQQNQQNKSSAQKAY